MIKGKLIDDCYEYRILRMNIEVNQKLGMNNIPVCEPDHIKYHLEVESDRHPHFLYCISQTVRRDLIQLKFESPRLGEKGRVFNLYDCIVPKFEEEYSHNTGEPLKMKLTLVAGMSYLNGEFMERLIWCRFNRDLIDKNPMVFTRERALEVMGEGEGKIRDCYFEDEEGKRINKPKKNQLVNLVIHTTNMAGKLLSVDLSDDKTDYEYDGTYLENDLLENIKVVTDTMRIELKTLKQRK
ncbi:hypothetical protein [Plebeiibacterium marinum]|uniref:Uncharacterized protein n=1 Tax=Plebeiibacterium marinum TaxID=2992111 RepID=A0AAE3MGI5_9BACT|nr:hypothetical protein [Plebeiobacterium marinum]MCW3807186.1 hypothetical protein [Plebeiobacterium marinum]